MPSDKKKREAREVQDLAGVPYTKALRYVTTEPSQRDAGLVLDITEGLMSPRPRPPQPTDVDIVPVDCGEGCAHPLMRIAGGTLNLLGTCQHGDANHVHFAIELHSQEHLRVSITDGTHQSGCAILLVDADRLVWWLDEVSRHGGAVTFARGADQRVFRMTREDAEGCLTALCDRQPTSVALAIDTTELFH